LLIQHLRDSAEKAKGSRTAKRRPAHETLELILQHGAARGAGNYQLTSELVKRCREAVREDLKERRAAGLTEAAEAERSIRNSRRYFANCKTKMTALRRPEGTISLSRRVIERVIYDLYSDFFDSHVHLPPCRLREDGYVIWTLARLFTRYVSECKQHYHQNSAILRRHHHRRQKMGSTRRHCVAKTIHRHSRREVMRRLEWDNMGVRVDGRLLHHLHFADDVVLITPNMSQAERMLADLDDACGKIGLQLNLTNTAFMRNG
ncbi:hypothetical protein ANCCEY_14066, partial [Ancylostoma ceylanicum]